MDLLIKNVTAVTMDDARPVVRNACIGISGGRIVSISEQLPEELPARVIDGRGRLCMPGLVNTHTHVSMTLMRGFADDYDLHTWLFDHVFPTEAKLNEQAVYIGAKLGMAEMLASGTVALTDMYMRIPEVARAAYEMGLYANISNGATCFDEQGYDFDRDPVTQEMRTMLRDWHGLDDGRIRLDVSIHGEYTSFPRLWEANAAFAREHGLNMHIHVSETRSEHEECIGRRGMTPTQALDAAGAFGTRTTVAHGVWLSDEDMALLAARDVTLAHNPVSNLKLGSGIARVARMMQQGLRVSLGTDGVCSNNNHDLFEELKLSAILQKGAEHDATLLPAPQALKMATVNGAYAQGREHELGMLKEGYDASLILLDTDRPGLIPWHDPHSALCYSARGGDVYMTMVRGRVLYENGAFPHVDLERLRAESKPAMERLFG